MANQLIRDLRRRSSILQQPARDRVATAAKPASWLWCAVTVKQRKKMFKRFLNLIGSLGYHQNLTHCWHHGTDIHAKFHNQPFIMCRAIWQHVFGHTDSFSHSHTQLNHQRLVSN